MLKRLIYLLCPHLKPRPKRPQAIPRCRINPIFLDGKKKVEGVANCVGVRITEEKK